MSPSGCCYLQFKPLCLSLILTFFKMRRSTYILLIISNSNTFKHVKNMEF